MRQHQFLLFQQKIRGMPQPIKKHIKENYSTNMLEKEFYTLIVDGNNLLEVAFHGDPKVNPDGLHIGGIYQFLNQLRLMLKRKDFQFCYVMWDGERSGQLRYQYYKDYKLNRGKNYMEIDGEMSDMAKEIDAAYREKMRYFAQKRGGGNKFAEDKMKQKEAEREEFERQKARVMQYLEEIFIRQVMDYETEGDDLMAYYINNKKPNEKIVLVSGDRDLTQLISDSVIIYVPVLKKFINTKNHVEEMGYRHENVLIKKIFTGDTSDNIKGIKGVGEKTFMDLFPEVKERPVTVEEIVDKARIINEDRVKEKKKPLKACENIVNKVTDGCQGDEIYEVNRKIIDLKNPLLTSSAKEEMDSIMYQPIDPEGRSFENLYDLLKEDEIFELTDGDKFGNFFLDFKRLVEKEKIFYRKNNNS